MNAAASITPLPSLVHEQYLALRQGTGFLKLVARTQIEVTGRDRSSFLHNLSTNHVQRLQPGQGCEAFITNVQGKILGHVVIYCQAESIVLDTVPHQAQPLIQHFDHYRIRERVEFHDRTDEWQQLLFASVPAQQRLADFTSAPLPSNLYSHCQAKFGQISVSLRKAPLAGPESLTCSVSTTDSEAIVAMLESQGMEQVSSQAYEVLRVESGWPDYGRDISADNFPHETNRTDRAVSFAKGCYLGQEPVARIDALGRVNWLLMGLRFAANSLPGDATDITREGKTVARLTSRVWSPRWQTPFAMAYVHRQFARSGEKLATPWGEAEVTAFGT